MTQGEGTSQSIQRNRYKTECSWQKGKGKSKGTNRKEKGHKAKGTAQGIKGPKQAERA